LRKKYISRRKRPSAAKADAANKPFIAAVNRCATQNQAQYRLFPQAVNALDATGGQAQVPEYAMEKASAQRI
jgi:hypothetical protein